MNYWGGGFFAIFVPSQPAELDIIITPSGYEVPLVAPPELAAAQQATIAMTAGLFRLEAASEGQIKVVRTVTELTTCLQAGVFAAILHFEGAEAIDPQLEALDVFYRAGLRSLGVVWSRPNSFAHGVPFRFPHSPDTGPG